MKGFGEKKKIKNKQPSKKFARIPPDQLKAIAFKYHQQGNINEAQKAYQEFINNLSEIINKSDKRLEQIDQRGIFKSDDEIGWFFNEVKKIKNNLAKFKVDL